MTPHEWSKLEALFATLCDLPPAEQKAELDRSALTPVLRHELEELLSFDGSIDLDDCSQSVAAQARAMEAGLPEGTLIGAYRVMRKLGAGGMGSVYLAERADGRFDAQVAIKVLTRRGDGGQRLLLRECQMLARFNHPGIARLIDAGETPEIGAWLVMEFVEGLNLREAIAEQNWPSARIIHYVATVAETIAAAHQRMILHQDLKPEHLLIDSAGRSRILDFGISALINPDGAYAAEVPHSQSYTPRYAAPEQLLNQPCTTATDVYALGLILFEALSDGTGPFDQAPKEIAEQKLYGRAPKIKRPTDLKSRQQQDLSAILDTALERKPEHRYPGPAALAADLRALLADRPVSVRRPSAPEAVRRWLGRNRLAGAALASALLAMILGTVVSSGFAVIAQQERDNAMREAQKATMVAGFLESLFETASPGPEAGPDIRARDLLVAGRQRLERELRSQPDVAADLGFTMATSFLNLGLYEDAHSLLESMGEWLPSEQSGEQLILQARLDNLAARHDTALSRLDHPALINASGNTLAAAELVRATAWINLGQHAPAQAAANAALTAVENNDQGVGLALDAQSALAAIAFARADYSAAQNEYRKMVDLNLKRHGEVHENTGMAVHNLAGVTFMLGNAAEAASLYKRSLAIKRKFYGTDNRAVAMTLRSLGLTYRRLGQTDQAELALTAAINAYREWNGAASPLTQEAEVQLIELLILDARESEAAARLAALPRLAHADANHARDLACRLVDLNHYFALSTDPLPDCEVPLTAASLRAVSLFLAAQRDFRRGGERWSSMRDEAIALTDTLLPSDPLLVSALHRIGSDTSGHHFSSAIPD